MSIKNQIENLKVGSKVRAVYKGVVVEGYVSNIDDMYSGYVHLSGDRHPQGESVFHLAVDKIDSIEMLWTPPPEDTYPVGTVLRWNDHGKLSTYVKQSDGNWTGPGSFQLSWPMVLTRRPLTVLRETETIE